MKGVLIAWGLSVLPLLLLAVWLGRFLGRGYAGILIDNRGRYSLTQFQLVLWTLLVLSLLSGLFFARAFSGVVQDALDFAIPTELLIVMGISLAGGAISSTIKAGKDASHPERIAASNAQDRPRFAQMFLVEEGALADQVVDVAKFQNFWLTLILVTAYGFLAIKTIMSVTSITAVVLPGFDDSFLVLLGISHAGYLAGKLPDQPGSPPGLTVALRGQGALPAVAPVASPPLSYAPRNPAPRF
jgi:hypothetical protein